MIKYAPNSIGQIVVSDEYDRYLQWAKEFSSQLDKENEQLTQRITNKITQNENNKS